NYGGGGGGGTRNSNGAAGANGYLEITYSIPGLANDNCNTATPLTINTSCSYTTYTTVGATASTGVPAPGCASYSGGDVWFSFVVPANGIVTVDTQTGGMTDSGMAWYTGTCGSLTLLECDDDDSANGLMSSITRTGLTPGATIYVRVWEYSNDNPGTFGICATSPGPCVTPGSQATGFTPGTITSTAFPATFSGTANAYLVIRSTSATPPSQPVNGVIYTGANIGTLGTGLTIVQDGTSTAITGTGLTGNTRYYYYIYAYNNTGCSGGPLYNASGPLTGNAVTCPATPSPVTTSSTLTSINFSWSSSLGGGINAVTYELQVTTNAGYTANVAGSPFTINDPTTTLNVTGLTANTTYYYRIRANNGCWSTYTTGTATTGYC
ncbi:MAG: fibronectin type III domain-containing protein, partial [Bacteroidia bacterium]